MPYPRDHKAKTRAKIVTSARALFNRRGFDQVTIDDVMAHAGLTRGGFYHHFKSKDELYGEAVASIAGVSPFSCRIAKERALGVQHDTDELAHRLVDMYLAEEMLADVDAQCPLYALPSDVARSGRGPRTEYTRIIERMAAVFSGAEAGDTDGRPLAAVALCVGGMVLARTTQDEGLAKHLRIAARAAAHRLLGGRDVEATSARTPKPRARPETARTETTRPKAARPKAARTETARPKTARAKPL